MCIGGNFCDSPMYADDLAPISDSPKDLQRMLIIVYAFSLKWRCKLNPKNSVVFVLEESTRSREAGGEDIVHIMRKHRS